MNSKTWTRIIALSLFGALALPLQLAAQNSAKQHHPSPTGRLILHFSGTSGFLTDFVCRSGLKLSTSSTIQTFYSVTTPACTTRSSA
jgi:hypothetical protein